MKEFSYSYLPISTFIIAQLTSLIVIPIFILLLLSIVKINPNLVVLIPVLSLIPNIYLSKIFLQRKATIKKVTIMESSIKFENTSIQWAQIKWYRFDKSKHGALEKIVIKVTSGDKLKIRYYDTRISRKSWSELKEELKNTIEANCENLEKAKLF